MFQIGDRVVDTYGARGVVVEVGILMRDSRDRVREALKIDLDPTEDLPQGVSGAYRFVETCKLVESEA